MPPCASAPPTSYWPATRSPACSFAVKSNRSPQLGQKPAVRPGLPPWPRPTGLSQRGQKRRRSGALGAAMTTDAGSADAIGAAAEATVPPLPARLPLPLSAAPPEPSAPVAAPLAGAIPHVSQYPSAIVPEQPARPQAMAVIVFDPLSGGWSGRGRGGWGRSGRGRGGGGPAP